LQFGGGIIRRFEISQEGFHFDIGDSPGRRGGTLDGLARRLLPSILLSLIGRAILVREFPLAVDKQGAQIVIRVAAFIPRGAIAHFEIDDLFLGFID